MMFQETLTKRHKRFRGGGEGGDNTLVLYNYKLTRSLYRAYVYDNEREVNYQATNDHPHLKYARHDYTHR